MQRHCIRDAPTEVGTPSGRVHTLCEQAQRGREGVIVAVQHIGDAEMLTRALAPAPPTS